MMRAAKRPSRLLAPALAGVFCFSVFFGCERPGRPVEVKEARLLMGTVCEITALGHDRAALTEAVSAAFSEMSRVESLMSSYRDDSDVSRINRSAGGEPVRVAPEVFELLSRSKDICLMSDGAFDVTAASFTGLWEFEADNPRVPSREEIEQRLGLTGCGMLLLDPEGPRAGLAREGARISLGGIAKGYAVDRAVGALRDRGVKSALVNAGGDIRALGDKAVGPWKVGVRHPRKKSGLIGRIEVRDAAVATSGDYEKFFQAGGVRYCHILDPRTGMPAQGVMSATVTAEEAWLADALATAVFVLGPEEGTGLARRLKGVEAALIARDGRRVVTEGLKHKLRWEEDPAEGP